MANAEAAAQGYTPRPTALIGFYLLLALITVLPLLGIDMPGLGDYPNHLARAAILADAGHSPALRKFFDPGWHFAPYAGMDVIVVALAQVMPIYTAGRIFIAICLLMPVLAAMALRRAATGQIGVLPACAFFVSYNYMLSRGFLTYLFGACLAVMLFALWIGTQRARPAWRLPVFALALIALYTCHAFAFAFYALLLGSFELWAVRDTLRAAPARGLARVAAAAATGLPAVIFAMLMQKNAGLAGHMDFRFGPLAHHLNALLSAFFFPSPAADLTELIVIPLGALMLFRHGAAMRRLIVPELAGTLLAVGLVALMMPETMVNIWGIFFRLPVMCVVLALGCVRPIPALPPRRARLVLASLVVLVGMRAAGAAVIMRQANHLADQTRAVLASLPPGQRLLVAQDLHADFELGTMVDHFGTLATIERAAYVPYLFLYMVQPRPDAPVVGSINAAAIDLARLNSGAAAWPDGVPRPPYQYGGQEYWRGWPAHFDYVLITHFGKRTAPLPAMLRHVAGNDFADLYAVLPR